MYLTAGHTNSHPVSSASAFRCAKNAAGIMTRRSAFDLVVKDTEAFARVSLIRTVDDFYRRPAEEQALYGTICDHIATMNPEHINLYEHFLHAHAARADSLLYSSILRILIKYGYTQNVLYWAYLCGFRVFVTIMQETTGEYQWSIEAPKVKFLVKHQLPLDLDFLTFPELRQWHSFREAVLKQSTVDVHELLSIRPRIRMLAY